MKEKKQRVVLYVKPHVAAMLERLAADERRSVSEYMEPLLDRWYDRKVAEHSPLAKVFATEVPKDPGPGVEEKIPTHTPPWEEQVLEMEKSGIYKD